MTVIAREPMIRTIREALDRHEHKHADNDGRAVAVVLAIEPLIAERLQGAVDALREARAIIADRNMRHELRTIYSLRVLDAAILAADRQR